MTEQIEPQPSRPTTPMAIVLALAVTVIVGGILSIINWQTEPSEDVSDPVTLAFLAAMIKTDGNICSQATSAYKVVKQTGERTYVVHCPSGRFRITIVEGKEPVVELVR